MDLDRVKIHLRLKLDDISPNFDPSLQKALGHFEEIRLEIPFFRSEQFRVQKEGDFKRISAVVGLMVNWLESHFGGRFPLEYYSKIASHVIVGYVWCLPWQEIEGDGIQNLGYFSVLLFLIDDLTDGDIKMPEGEGFDANAMQMLLQKGFNLCFKLGYDAEMLTGLTKSGDVFTKCVIGALIDAFNKMGLSDKGKTELMQITLPILHSDNWIRRNVGKILGNPGTCSLNVFRKFRDIMSGPSVWSEGLYSMDYEPIPEYLRRNPVLTTLNGLADRIGACLNDILGFMKDVRKGSLDGVILYRIQGGMNPNEAVQEEALVLGEAVQDYLVTRKMLMKEEKELKEYIKILDSHLYGVLQAFVNTDRYGLIGFLEIIAV